MGTAARPHHRSARQRHGVAQSTVNRHCERKLCLSQAELVAVANVFSSPHRSRRSCDEISNSKASTRRVILAAIALWIGSLPRSPERTSGPPSSTRQRHHHHGLCFVRACELLLATMEGVRPPSPSALQRVSTRDGCRTRRRSYRDVRGNRETFR